MLLLRLAICSIAAACALSAPLSLLREPDSTSNDFDTFVSGLNSEDPGSVLLGPSFTDGLSGLLHAGVGDTIEAGLAGTGPPRLPATRVTLNFGISVDVGELPDASESDLPSSMPSALASDADGVSLARSGLGSGDQGDAEPARAAAGAIDVQ